MEAVPVLDELMANAWRPVVTETFGGWRFRWAHGVTRRANSALALGGGDVDALVAKAEAFYRAHHAPAMIQVSTASAPRGLVPLLHARGYRAGARTLVEQAATTDVIARTRPGAYDIAYATTATDEWFDAYWSTEGSRSRHSSDMTVCRTVLLASGLPAVFAAACVDGTVIGTGQLVVDRGWGGVQCMATSRSNRRQGVAQAILHALATEALCRDVQRLYLAVMADNEPAVALYATAGFEVAHEYSYFTERSHSIRADEANAGSRSATERVGDRSADPLRTSSAAAAEWA